MAVVLKSLYRLYNEVFYEYSDPRTRNWFLCGSPWPILSILAFYNYFVRKIGPDFMKDRKPLNVDRLIQIYNVAQVVFCFNIFVQAVRICYGPYGSYSWRCEPVDYSESPTAKKVLWYTWSFYMLKVIDLLDTVFFVLRKKNSQISFLHLYHHSGMVLLSYGGLKYLPGGHGVFLGMINSFVHSIMYGYYFITNYNPEYKKNNWWKKYITQIQMAQFLMLIIFFGQILFQTDCGYPKWAVLVFLPQDVFMFLMFADFYRKAYLSPKKSRPRCEDDRSGTSESKESRSIR